MEKEVKIISILVGVLLFSSLISAGIGIKTTQESAMVNEGEKTCLTYGVYNPFSSDTNAMISVSDPLQEVLIMQEAETKLIPSGTSSADAISIEFCFKVPYVYYRDCSVAEFICKQDCNEPQKEYAGEVILRSVPGASEMTGAGGSATEMSIGTPLRIRVRCNPHTRDYSLIYILVAVVSALAIIIGLFKKYRKPKEQRMKEKMQKLRKEMKKGKKK